MRKIAKNIPSAPQIGASSQGHLHQHINADSPAYRVCRDNQMVSKVVVEEKEQELLVKAETIQVITTASNTIAITVQPHTNGV